PAYEDGQHRFAWHDVAVARFWTDAAREVPFTGQVLPAVRRAVGADGNAYRVLYGDAVETGAPLTQAAVAKGLDRFGLGGLGSLIVLLSVLLLASSTAISWSYYGHRCATYLFGSAGLLPYQAVFVAMHFVGALASL